MSSQQLGWSTVVSRLVFRIVFAGAMVVASFAVASCGGGNNQTADASGKVTIVYHDEEIKPENRKAVEVIRKSGVFERVAAWVNKVVALPHDLVVNVTDKVPPGVTDAVTQPDGRTIFVPASFLTENEQLNSEVVTTVRRPALFPEDKFNVDDLNVLSAQFIVGHEFGHALQRQLLLPNLGLEEDASDGFASFYTVNDVGPDPSLAAALLFDAVARKGGAPTLDQLSSDHPVTQQRAFNFLCLLDGSDTKRYDGPLIDAGYLPKSRAPLCQTEWTQLDYGWWTQLMPHFTQGFKDQGTKEQEKARAALIAATNAFAQKIDQIRTGH